MRKASVLSVTLEGLAACAITALIVAGTSLAHPPSNFYFSKWHSSERTQFYDFEDGFPAGDFRDRVENGARQWTQLGSDMDFRRGTVRLDYDYGPCSKPSLGENGIFWEFIDGEPGPGESRIHAQTKACAKINDPSHIRAFQMRFDSGDNWHTGLSDPPGSRVDAFSLGAHEFGHAGGFFGHFDDGASICDPGAPKQTMCQGLNYGQMFWRSLEEHDRHVFKDAYP